VVVTTDARVVAAVTDTIRPLISAVDPSAVSITDSEALASLRGTVQDQLGAFGGTLAAGVLTLTGLLVAIVQIALVLLRRKDFGRRRALGATRGLIIALVLIQAVCLAVAGATLGVTASVVALTAIGDPLPGLDYTVAVVALAVCVSVAAAIFPAILASRRDPIKELRVP
jgi:putative ABC transport system permease protein